MEKLEKFHLIKLAYRLSPYIEMANPFLIFSNVPYWLRKAPDGLPIPPLSLIHKVTSSISIPWFLESGRLSVVSIEYALEKNGMGLNDFTTILDFGCGCGRVIRHLESTINASLYGTDYNTLLINWCKNNLPFANFSINKTNPPLEFSNDFFDFIYAISVFTHIPEDLQLAWIKEFSRVLKPDGILLVTTHGEHYIDRLTGEEKDQFYKGQLIIKRSKYFGTNLCTTFHPEEYVRKRILKDFKILDFIPEGMKGAPYQDIYLVQNLK